MKKALTLFFLLVSFSGVSQDFVLPCIPDTIKEKDDRIEYIVLHYWDNYDFEDPYIFIEGNTMLEYFVLLKDVPYNVSSESIFQTLNKASRSNQIFSLFIDTYRIYLFHPESFFCDYERYLAVAEFVIANEQIPQSSKSDFLLEKEVINTNRIGDKATNFVVEDRNGNPIKLYNINTDFILVFFHNPNCGICAETKEKLLKSEIIGEMIDAGKLKVFAVCPYNEYDLWETTEYPENWLSGYDKEQRINKEYLYYFLESSSIYLLDKDKNILMKDARLDLLEAFLSHQF